MSGPMNLTTGTVIDVDDPEQRGRVKVEYHSMAKDAPSDWIRVASIAAGSKMGAYFMPELGHVAVVGFIDGHMNEPVVVGFVWTGTDETPGESPRERVFKSSKGHKLTLSDEAEDGIVIEDAHGNKILMNKEGITIESHKALNIKAGSTAIIEASGEATVKGAPLQLNP